MLHEQIDKIIQKSPGKDTINAKLLKEISKQERTPLTHNLSFATGKIPTTKL